MAKHALHASQRSRREEKSPWSRRSKFIAAIIGFLLAATGAYSVTNRTVNLNSGSSGQAQSGTVSNLTITAIASPSPNNLLYPGGNGDVVLTITNPNPITAFDLPTNTTYATGYTT